MLSVRTDLAIESKEFYESQNSEEQLTGVSVKNYFEEEIEITEVKIIDEVGEKALGKPIGTYITINLPEYTHYDTEIMEQVSKALSNCISNMVQLDKSMTVLVVGLGNWMVTPDAVGPKVVSKLMITRHLKEYMPNSIDEGIRPVCAISPGVLGITGIETGEVIKSIVDKIKPNLIICIDALASRKMSRLNKTIQIGDTGISPGSGVGNKRMELSEKTLGIPVLALGVPTVVDAATMASDTIDLVLSDLENSINKEDNLYNILRSIDKTKKYSLIEEILNPFGGNLVVTPKEIDMIIESLAKIIASGINIALQPALTLDEIKDYLN